MVYISPLMLNINLPNTSTCTAHKISLHVRKFQYASLQDSHCQRTLISMSPSFKVSCICYTKYGKHKLDHSSASLITAVQQTTFLMVIHEVSAICSISSNSVYRKLFVQVNTSGTCINC